jgi:hypothetical protein
MHELLLAAVLACQIAPAPVADATALGSLEAHEQHRYQTQTGFKDRINLFEDVVERYAKEISKTRKEGRLTSLDGLGGRYEQMLGLLEKELARPVNKKDRSRELKRLEIRLRKSTDDFRAEQSVVPTENSGPFQKLIEATEKLRSKIIQILFSGVYK